MPGIIGSDGKDYTISGKMVTEKDYPELEGRIGPGEAAIEVPAKAFERSFWRQYKRGLIYGVLFALILMGVVAIL